MARSTRLRIVSATPPRTRRPLWCDTTRSSASLRRSEHPRLKPGRRDGVRAAGLRRRPAPTPGLSSRAASLCMIQSRANARLSCFPPAKRVRERWTRSGRGPPDDDREFAHGPLRRWFPETRRVHDLRCKRNVPAVYDHGSGRVLCNRRCSPPKEPQWLLQLSNGRQIDAYLERSRLSLDRPSSMDPMGSSAPTRCVPRPSHAAWTTRSTSSSRRR